MNIKHRAEFDRLLSALASANVAAVDTETSGLNIHEGHRPISMSFFFPELEESYNFAWAHGAGRIFIPQANRDMNGFHRWTWQGNGKKQVYKAYWFDQYHRTQAQDWGNCPLDWLEELRQQWNENTGPGGLHAVYFNAPFDIHMMETVGFRQPASTEDVRIAVSLVFEDWLYSGLVDANDKPISGSNNTLKWQSSYWKIDGALDGEHDLRQQAEALSVGLAAYVLEHWEDPMNASFHKLKRAARIDEIAKRIRFDPKSEMWCLPSDAVALYAENDTKITWKLREKLLSRLKAWDQVKLYQDLSAAQSEFLVRTERGGLLLDRNRAEELIDEMRPIMDEVNRWFSDELKLRRPNQEGEIDFNAASPAKLKAALSILTGVDWPATDKDTVQDYEDVYGEHEAINQLHRYRHAQRAVRTYLRKWLSSQDEQGFIHGSFNINGTITGRLSSSSGTLGDTGNYQNIPSRGFNIKECLVSPPGWTLFQIDYAQLELRLAAWIAGCNTMIGMFERGEDLHAYTRDMAHVGDILHPGLTLWQAVEKAEAANKLEGHPETDQEALKALATYYRHVAKTLNFGLLYGGTWRMVNRLLRVGEGAAHELHDAWNRLYPEYAEANREWMKRGLTYRPQPNGQGRMLYVVQPISQRTRKFLPYPESERLWDEDAQRWFTLMTRERKAKDAFNFAVQGLGGYLMVMSSLQMCREFDPSVFWPFASVHDSIDFYVRDGHFDILPRLVEIMCDWPIRPQLEADVEVSVDGTWQHMKKVKDIGAIMREAV